MTNEFSRDHTDRFALDQLLRKHGYIIFSRKKKGPAEWKKNGKILAQREALKKMPFRELQLANRARVNYIEDTYS